MILNNIQLCRTAALVDGLRLLNENNVADKLTENQLCGLQQFTLDKSTQYAEAYGVDFPDETLPESLLATLTNRSVGRPSLDEMERLTALAPSYPRTLPAWETPSDDWSEIEARESEAYAFEPLNEAISQRSSAVIRSLTNPS